MNEEKLSEAELKAEILASLGVRSSKKRSVKRKKIDTTMTKETNNNPKTEMFEPLEIRSCKNDSTKRNKIYANEVNFTEETIKLFDIKSNKKDTSTRNKISDDIKQKIVQALDNESCTRSSAAVIFGLPYETVSQIYRRHLKGHLPKKRGGKKDQKLKDADKALIKEKLRTDCTMTLVKLQKLLYDDRRVSVSLPTISKVIPLFNYTIVRNEKPNTTNMNSKQLLQRNEFSEFICNVNDSKKPIFFVDSTNFCVSIRRHYGSSNNKECAIIRVPAIKIRSQTIIACMNKEKLYHYKAILACNDNEYLKTFLKELFLKLELDQITDAVIVMNHVTFSKYENLRELIFKYGHEIRFFPDYEDGLNPIENLFSLFESIVRSIDPQNEDEIMTAMDNFDAAILSNICRESVLRVRQNGMKWLKNS